jgi:anti-sigma regulatory factor (Ser/Thr protein kinase)/plasmid stability protein
VAVRKPSVLRAFGIVRDLFKRRELPYEGADLATARRFTALLWTISGVLSLVILPVEPPDGSSLGAYGWLAGAVIAGLSFAGARWVLSGDERAGFNGLLVASYAGLAQVAALAWLADGGSAYRPLFMLWLGAGVAIHPPRRGVPYVAAVVAAGSLPLLYSARDSRALVDTGTNALLWVAVGVVLMLLISRVRTQRSELQGVELDARERAEEAVRRVRGLEAVSDAALAHLPFEELLSELLERITKVLDIESAVILLNDGDTGALRVRAARGEGTGAAERRRVPRDGLAGRVAEERQPVFMEQIVDAGDPAAAEAGAHVRSLLGVPLLVRGGRVIGVLQVASPGEGGFTEDDAGLLQLAADRLAVAIDRAQLNEQAHKIAETLQRSLLPSRIPDIPGLSIATRYQPGAAGAAVGGDLFDVVEYLDGRVGLAIGDVVGRGIEAASLMGQLRNGLRAYALEGGEPADLVERLNRLVSHWDEGQIATMLYMLVDPRTSTLSLATAGHLPPVVRGPDGTTSILTTGEFVPLGVLPFGAYRESVVAIEPGSTIILYTDGLVEERGMSVDDGMERLRAAVSTGPQDPDALADHVLETVPTDGIAGDDVAVLIARLDPVPSDRFELRLPAEPESMVAVRRTLERWLDSLGAERQTIYELTVACGEACMNVVEHAYPGGDSVFVLAAAHEGGEVELQIRDFGYWRPARKSDRGRGLELMRRLTDSAKITPGPQGTTVRLRRSIRPGVTA